MGDKLIKWLLKDGGGHIFETYDISLQNTPTSHVVSLALFIYTCRILQCFFVMLLLTANGFCLHSLVWWCFFGSYFLHNHMYYGINWWVYF